MVSFGLHPEARAVCFAAMLLALCTPACAVKFAGGTGEPNDPYQIATAQQLTGIGSDPNLLDKHFVLVADIDLAPGRPGGGVFGQAVIPMREFDDDWHPVGFTGSFDGAGHAIRNVTIVYDDWDGTIGLFAWVSPAGRISNLLMQSVNIQCPDTDAVGALAGYNEGVIVNCTVDGNVSGVSDIGGLAGCNKGTIRGCRAGGFVVGQTNVGGLVGGNDDGLIECCMASGTVVATDPCSCGGGLVGSSGGTVLNCYAAGFVAGESMLGGLIGACGAGRVANCYACTEVVSTSGGQFMTVGGLIGEAEAPVLVESCYVLASEEYAVRDNGLGTFLTNAQMRQRASFAGWDFAGQMTDGFADVWMMPDDGGYPVLATLNGRELPLAPGSGTVDDPYLIGALEDLPTMFRIPDAHYRLTGTSILPTCRSSVRPSRPSKATSTAPATAS